MTKRKLPWGDETGIVAKADKVAKRLSKTVPCDGVYISLANRNRLYSFGMTGAGGSDDVRRHHAFADTVCGVTITRNASLDFSDARLDDELAKIPYVTQGAIVGYLGKPIRDADAKAIGAICAVSAQPRSWSEADKLKLQMSCMEAEYLLATELLKKEMRYLSAALGEYDRIVMSLTDNIKLMTSVHDENGDLLFATNALLEEIDATLLEEAVRNHRQNANILEFQDARKMPARSPKSPAASDMVVCSRIDAAKRWRATIQTGTDSVSFVSWRVDASGPTGP